MSEITPELFLGKVKDFSCPSIIFLSRIKKAASFLFSMNTLSLTISELANYLRYLYFLQLFCNLLGKAECVYL